MLRLPCACPFAQTGKRAVRRRCAGALQFPLSVRRALFGAIACLCMCSIWLYASCRSPAASELGAASELEAASEADMCGLVGANVHWLYAAVGLAMVLCCCPCCAVQEHKQFYEAFPYMKPAMVRATERPCTGTVLSARSKPTAHSAAAWWPYRPCYPALLPCRALPGWLTPSPSFCGHRSENTPGSENKARPTKPATRNVKLGRRAPRTLLVARKAASLVRPAPIL